MNKQTDLISRLQDEADLCRNEGADDIAALLNEAVGAIRDRNHDTQVGAKWREDSRLETWFPITAERLVALEAENAALKRDLQYTRDGLTKGRSRMREDNERLAREAYTWSKAAEVYAADSERYRWLRQRYDVLCRMHTAQGLGLDLSTVYVRSAEQFDGVIDAAMAPRPVLGGA